MTNQELLTSWNSEVFYNDRPNSDKILPQAGKRNILITSALPYVNNVPHLGNIIGCVLSGDCFSRYCRLRGHQALYICGTDEYGTATETKALQEGLTPRQICDKYHALHKDVYEWFNIDFDHFGRTTTDFQTEITQDIFLKLHANGFTSTSSMDQLYCEHCSKFLADRFVTGICPTCAYDDARGDQCDGCGKLINAVELKQPKCHMCKQQPAVRQSTHIFLQLDKLQDEVNTYVESQINRDNTRWSANAISIIKGWVKKGLEKRCITRDLKWGIPVPLAEFEDKVFYVWFDAPVGYLSITKELLGDNWTKWWKNPKEVELYNFLGKDNVAFHGIMFPSSQIGARDNYTVVNNICATEYLNYEDTKFSKSRGVGVFGNDAQDTGIEPDIWRFYLLYMRPENQDTAFSWDDFALKVNSELLANLGNFINRALSFLKNNFNGVVPEMQLDSQDLTLLKDIKEESERWDNLFDSVKLRDGVRSVLEMSRKGNQYMQAQKPWELIKGNDKQKKRAGTIIGVAANIAYHLAIVLQPIMPEVSQRIREQCNLQKMPLFQVAPIAYLKAGHKIGEPKPLFAKMEPSLLEELKIKFGGSTAASLEASKNSKTSEKTKPGNSKESKKLAAQGKAEQNMTTITRNFPQLCKNQQVIKQLLETNKNKFEQARSLFVKEKLSELEKASDHLEKEVTEVLSKLVEAETAAGKKQMPVPKKEAAAANNAPSAPAVEKATPAAAVSKGEEKKGGKKEDKSGKKEDKSKSGAKKVEAAAEDTIDIGRIDLRVGRIVQCEKHPDADALYLEKIDVGEAQPRTVISGLVKWVPLEQMQNRLVIVMCNLKPAKMRGIESQAMVMCASSPEKVEIMEIDAASVPGTSVLCPPYAHRPDAILNPKKKVWETVAEDLKVSPDGIATWKGQPLLVGGATNMTAPTLRNVNIK